MRLGTSAQRRLLSCCPPCKPVRSLWAKRASYSLLVCLLTVTGLTWASVRPANTNLLSPGPLTLAHSSLKQDCSVCHPNVNAGSVTQLFRAQNHRSDLSARCLECHDLGPHPGQAHDLSPAYLAAVTAQVATQRRHQTRLQTLVRTIPGLSHTAQQTTACSACHREHAGRANDLSRISDQQCQVCHLQTFSSLAHGHPEFSHYPYLRRTRIRFDHQTHYATHFANSERTMPDAAGPDSCTDCHVADPEGNMVLLRGYEASCATCHDAQIRDDSLASASARAAPGIVFFRLEPLDPTEVTASDTDIGQWPSSIADPVIRNLPPFVQLLLRENDEFQEAWATLRADQVISGGNDTRAFETCVWTVKELLHDLSRGGPASLRERLVSTAASAREQHSADRLTDALVGSAFLKMLRLAQRDWLPDLSREIAASRQGTRPRTVAHPVDNDTPFGLPHEIPSGWWQHHADFSLRYQPVAHADPLARYWIEYLVSLSKSSPAIFHQAIDPTAPGRCIKCHTIDRSPKGDCRVNWLASDSELNRRSDFAHGPHLVLLGQASCSTCHQLRQQVDFVRSEFVDQNWRAALEPQVVETSGFVPISKQSCSQCHSPEQASSGCLTCHKYHRGSNELTP